MRILLAVLLVPFALATVVGLVLLHPFDRTPVDDATSGPRVDGHITATVERPCDDEPGSIGCLALSVRLDEGPLAGQTIETLITAPRGVPPFGTGDDVVLTTAGGLDTDPAAYQIVDQQRDTPLLLLGAIFAAAVVALGRWRGLAALAGLGMTGVVLIGFVLPAILAGRNPLVVAVVGSFAIMFSALYLTHGFSARTSTAVLGTLGSLLLIGLLGITFTQLARLTGADEDTASLGATLGTAIDGRGLLLAGLVIGALGALDDVTVTQTTAVWELRAADPDLPPAALFGAAMRIGRDHVASAVNTLVLAYAGTALPLLLLFSVAERGLVDTLTTQVIATELVRTLVGSIGLVVSVPLTTALAVVVAGRGELRPTG
ncbi:MAG TPA: YibE/F family protein [Pseudonocardia sp.]|nr:YibE/F family protein [Pseudonocardia sp.]